MSHHRQARVADRIREILARLIREEVRDPRVGFVTVTGVDMSPDLRHARVFYRVLGSDTDPDRAQLGLERAVGYIQSVVGRELRLRYTPELCFVFDPSLERAERVDQLLAESAADGTSEETGEGWD